MHGATRMRLCSVRAFPDDPFEAWLSACKMVRLAHFDAEILGFMGPSNRATVIVGQHDDGFIAELGVKCSFAGAVEAVAVDECKHRVKP